MLSKCPVCGRGYNIFDRIAQPPICIPCAQAGAKDPNYDRTVADAESDRFWGRAMIGGAVALLAVVMFVPAREGASPGSKWALAGIALTTLAGGMTKTAAATRALKKKRRSRPPESNARDVT
jgi:hypothetical protein